MKTPEPITETTHARVICYDIVAYGKARMYGQTATLEILQPHCGDEGVYFPAQSIGVNNAAGVLALRDLCNEILASSAELNKPKQ